MCKFISDDTEFEHFQKCRFEMPDVGRYAIRYCIIGETPDFCKTKLKGKNMTTWENDPLSSNFPIETFVETKEIDYGKKAVFYVDLPYENSQLLAFWGNEVETKYLTFKFEEIGLSQFEIDIGDECRLGCQVKLAYVIPYQKIPLAKNVPKRVEFDPKLPRSFFDDIDLEIKDQANTKNSFLVIYNLKFVF